MRPPPHISDAELERICEVLQRASGRVATPVRARPANRAIPWWLILLCATNLFLLAYIALSSSLKPHAAPRPVVVATATPNPSVLEARPTPAPVSSLPAPRAALVRQIAPPRAQLVSLGEPQLQDEPVSQGESFWVHMPDGRWIVATYVARASQLSELPMSGNRVGDARYVGEQAYIWLRPVGGVNPTWIDP